MVPGIARSRSSLFDEITNLKNQIAILTESINTIVQWISTQQEQDGKDLPNHIIEAIKCCTEISSKPPELVVVEVVNSTEVDLENNSIPVLIRKEFKCRICHKKLKNLNVLKAHEKEHLPAEVIVPYPKTSEDGRILKRNRQAYRCLTCGAIITDRRKYMRHVNIHRKNSKSSGALKGNNRMQKSTNEDSGCDYPFVKLQDLTSLKEKAVNCLTKEHGITNFTSIISGLISPTYISADITSDNEEVSSGVAEEEVASFVLPSFDAVGISNSCDPLAEDDYPITSNNNNELGAGVFLEDAKNFQTDEILYDVVKKEIKEELDLVEEDEFQTEHETHKKISELEIDSHEQLFEDRLTSNNESIPYKLRQRKTKHRVLNEYESPDEGALSDSGGSSYSNESNRIECDICYKKLKNREVFIAHKREHLPPEVVLPWKPDGTVHQGKFRKRQRYKCLTCGLIMSARRQYLTHVNLHTKGDSNTSGKDESLRDERNGVNDENKTSSSGFKCDLCDKVTKTEENLRKHKKEHVPPEAVLPWREDGLNRINYIRQRCRYRCLVCQVIMTDKRKYLSHVANHSKSDSELEKAKKIQNIKIDSPVTCKICNKELKSQSVLKQHSKEHTLEEFVIPLAGKFWDGDESERRYRKYRCPVCEIIMSDKRRFITHINAHKKGIEPPVEESVKFKCRFCSKTFATSLYHVKHEKTHENGDGVEKGDKAEHVASEGGTTVWKSSHKIICEVCGQRFLNPSSLQLHMRKHTGNRPFLCFQCGKRFYRKSQLIDHEYIHMETRTFQCGYCDVTFKQRQSKYIHERLHNENSRVVCDLCGFTFSGRANLLKHISGIHENKRPFGCHLCEKSFKTKTALTYHVNTHSNPNSKNRGLNRIVDPMLAAAKRRSKGPLHRVPIVTKVVYEGAQVNEGNDSTIAPIST